MKRLVLVALFCGACSSPPFREAQELGGRTIPAAQLNRGRRVYEAFCLNCHGERGDGQGPAARSMRPPPRSFREGIFRYRSTPGESLPADEDLLRVITRGVPGTEMPPWTGLDEASRRAVADYLKTFSPRWRVERPGPPLAEAEDPWKDEAAAVRRGEEVYHESGGCDACHPSYRLRRPRPSHGPPRVVATDFLRDPLHGGSGLGDIYRATSVGIGGTEMPGTLHRLPASDRWAVAHYVRDLVRRRGTPWAARWMSLGRTGPAGGGSRQ